MFQNRYTYDIKLSIELNYALNIVDNKYIKNESLFYWKFGKAHRLIIDFINLSIIF